MASTPSAPDRTGAEQEEVQTHALHATTISSAATTSMLLWLALYRGHDSMPLKPLM
jgi:hypothetical protein